MKQTYGYDFQQSQNGFWIPCIEEPEPEPEPEPELLSDLRDGFIRMWSTFPKVPSWTMITFLVILLSIKISRVTHGDLTTMKAVLSSSSIGDLVAPATLVILQTMCIAMVVASSAVPSLIRKHWKLRSSKIIVIVVYLASVLVITSVVLPREVFAFIALVTIAVTVGYGYMSRDGRLDNLFQKEQPDSTANKWEMWFGIFLMLASGSLLFFLLLNIFLDTSYWGPTHLVATDNQEVVAYVITNGDVATTLMRDDDRSLMIVKNDDIRSITACKVGDGERNVYSLLNPDSQPNYPWCYGPPAPFSMEDFLGPF